MKRSILLLFTVSLAASLQGRDSSVESLIERNYQWDEYFENSEVTIIESNNQNSPCDPIVKNSGSLFTTNLIAEIKVPSYRVIERLKNKPQNELIIDYLMKRLESNIQVLDLPEAHQVEVTGAIRNLISEGCFEALLLASNEPIQSYLTIHHSRGTSEGLSYATKAGFIFHQKSFMQMTKGILNPKANKYPQPEFEEPEIEVLIEPLPDTFNKR